MHLEKEIRTREADINSPTGSGKPEKLLCVHAERSLLPTWN